MKQPGIIKKVINIARNKGFYYLFILAIRKIVGWKKFYTYYHKRELRNIIHAHKGMHVIIFPQLVDWNIPLFQRPQHIALNLAKQGFLYFYCTPNVYDKVNGFSQISDNCYITNRYDLVQNLKIKKTFHIYSTDLKDNLTFLEKVFENGDIILYEYIDEIHKDLLGDIPFYVQRKHLRLLKDERCIVVATANKLLNEVKQHRSGNYKLVTNGVDYKHFQNSDNASYINEEIQTLVIKNKPVIGYFGAFASWFDYELIKKIAIERPQYEILLIGWKYDDTIDEFNLNEHSNVTVIGPVSYQNLPYYANCFSVSIIPFLLNEVTESTSPIKLFEYMALGFPIVTTDLPECRKYKSVIVSEDHSAFLKNIDKALILKEDTEYKSQLNKDALNNTWESKAKSIAELLNSKISEM